jgi:sporulation integral membrane protein YlbJ
VILLKIHFKNLLLHLPKILCTFILIIVIIINPKTASDGIKNGITLLLSTVIPSLFPFLVLSSYIASSKAFTLISEFFGKATLKIFRINPDGSIPILMGLLGGYPIGAKITADLYKSNRITQNEAERLMFFTVNSGPAFTITAVGMGMLGNYYSGLILYLSTVITSLVIGFLCRFLSDKKEIKPENFITTGRDFAFINSVSSGANAIINISAWVLTFSCISGIINSFNLNDNFKIFLNVVLEVTNGCKICSGNMSLPVISAILGFGGFSVICQSSPYLKDCNVKMKNFIVSRILNSALSAFFTSQLLNLFPKAQESVVIYTTNSHSIGITYTASATVILIIMCVIFILQVDNRKKVC